MSVVICTAALNSSNAMHESLNYLKCNYGLFRRSEFFLLLTMPDLFREKLRFNHNGMGIMYQI